MCSFAVVQHMQPEHLNDHLLVIVQHYQHSRRMVARPTSHWGCLSVADHLLIIQPITQQVLLSALQPHCLSYLIPLIKSYLAQLIDASLQGSSPYSEASHFSGHLNLQKSKLDAKPVQVCVGLVTEVTDPDQRTVSDQAPDENVGHNACVGQKVPSDRGGGIVQQPGLQSSPLVGVPICSNHWLLHWCLQSQRKFSTTTAERIGGFP